MLIVCSWHKKYFGEELFMGEKEPLTDASITHGICSRCKGKLAEEAEAFFKKQEVEICDSKKW